MLSVFSSCSVDSCALKFLPKLNPFSWVVAVKATKSPPKRKTKYLCIYLRKWEDLVSSFPLILYRANIKWKKLEGSQPDAQQNDLIFLIIFFQNKECCLNTTHVSWVPCHHGMARPQVADGGDSLQFWRVAANLLNKQSRTAAGVVLQLGGWAHILAAKNKLVTKDHKKPQTWTYSLENRPKRKKMDEIWYLEC
jgi:hypothetical protein